MKKRLFASLICAMLSVSLMASCGNNGSSSSNSGSSTTGSSSGSSDNDLRESELVTLDVVTMSSGKNEPDITMVEDEMNKILEEKFNCNVDLTFISYANYVEQTSLMLSSGQDADLLAVYMVPLPTCANSGQIIPLDDLERELLKVKNGKENMWPVAVSAGENIRNWGWDPLGDDTVNLGVLADMATDSTVVNLYETDQYKDLAKEMYAWMQEGLIQADAVNTTETATTLMSAGTAFGYFSNLKPGSDAENTSALGFEVACLDIVPALGCTNNVSRATWAISSGCKHPEAAMKVLNELFTNPELSNLYMYGIEGTHYKVLEKGGASNGQDIITWADGLDATTSNYRKSGTWLQPNQFIGDVWEGSAADIWDQQRAFNNNAQKSVAFGFTYDSATVTNEVTACTNVVSKYNKALLCGALDPDTTLDKFNEELYAAGLQNIIDEKQRQLNTWLENYGG